MELAGPSHGMAMHRIQHLLGFSRLIRVIVLNQWLINPSQNVAMERIPFIHVDQHSELIQNAQQ